MSRLTLRPCGSCGMPHQSKTGLCGSCRPRSGKRLYNRCSCGAVTTGKSGVCQRCALATGPTVDLPTGQGLPCRDQRPDREDGSDPWFDLAQHGAETVAEVKALCVQCPVRVQCLALADSVECNTYVYVHGIWGGLTPTERIDRRKKRAAAKRKVLA